MNRSLRRRISSAAVAAVCLGGVWPALRAEEGGTGHYFPGGAASFIDALPGKPAWAVASYFLYYDGVASAGVALPFGGQVTLDAHCRSYADSVVALYQSPLKLLGGSYATGLVIPYVWLEVDGKATGPRGNTTTVRDRASGLGDLTLYPFMLGWVKGDLKYDVRLAVYAPTGAYEAGRLANIGKNYWTFEPVASASWISSKIGTEVSLFAGLDFSTENHTTNYQSGDVLHLDATVAQHLPLKRVGVLGIGANGFYYQQITGDSGSGATLGDFNGRTAGVGPVVSFITKLGKTDLVAEVKWLPELDVERRIKGDTVWLKLAAAF